MRASGWVLAVITGSITSWGLAVAVAEPKDPKPLPVDMKDLKDKVLVLRDGDGGTYVVAGHEKGAKEQRVWYGTGKSLYEQVMRGRGRDGDSWSFNIWAPRIAETRPGTVAFKKDGTYFKSCDGKDDAVLTEVTGDKAKEVVDKYKFLSTALVRRPYLFARDDAGIYYYVDKIAELYGGKGFRVWVGRKGAMKNLPLVDVASDSAGQVFSTKTGDLRLVRTTEARDKDTTTWVKGERKTQLIQLDLDVNSPVIFKDLGIYKFTGTICDNI